MANKNKTTAPDQPPAKIAKGRVLQIQMEKGKSEARIFAEAGMSPAYINGQMACTFAQGVFGEIDLTESVKVLSDKCAKLNAGDKTEMENMLFSQSIALQSIFSELIRRASINMGTHLDATESYMRLAFKAQAQCTRTLEVLAAVKNPPVVYAKQANFANGHQQVNNGIGQYTPTGNLKNEPNELLNEGTNATLDTRGASAPVRTNQELETVGKIDGATDGRGKVRRFPKQLQRGAA